jgi:hypothetical protein
MNGIEDILFVVILVELLRAAGCAAIERAMVDLRRPPRPVASSAFASDRV